MHLVDTQNEQKIICWWVTAWLECDSSVTRCNETHSALRCGAATQRNATQRIRYERTFRNFNIFILPSTVYARIQCFQMIGAEAVAILRTSQKTWPYMPAATVFWNVRLAITHFRLVGKRTRRRCTLATNFPTRLNPQGDLKLSKRRIEHTCTTYGFVMLSHPTQGSTNVAVMSQR